MDELDKELKEDIKYLYTYTYDLEREDNKIQKSIDDLSNKIDKWSNKEELLLTNNNSFKSYMDYRKVTNKNTKQYKLINSNNTKIKDNGLIEDSNSNVYVAMASVYGSVGDVLEITLDNNTTISVLIVDIKSNKDVENGQHKLDKSVVEFVVDTNKLSRKVKMTGDISSIDGYEGNITSISKSYD